MAHLRTFLTRLTMPTISSRRKFLRYVLLVNAFGLIVAFAIDITQQLVFFTIWAAVLRSWALTFVAVIVIATPVAVVFARAQRDVQSAKKALEDLSRTDPLTDLPNRRALMEAGEASTSQTMVLVIADIDRFKAVNDTYGHRAGDAVLQTIGRIMTAHLARYGLVGRLGGEEFALIAANASLEQILPVLGDLLRAIETTPLVTPGGLVRITMSAGIAIRDPFDPFGQLYSEADQALYQAKRSGRNRIELSTRAREALTSEWFHEHAASDEDRQERQTKN
ncbi:GGDEF domain-containing protein [Microvirga sp. P5_D2]